MQTNNFSLEAYFQRIHFEGVPEATIECVTALMQHQLYAVPFENLDVQAGKLVSIVPEDIVDKIVNRQRGGYCYEVNGLFSLALTALGVPYRWVAARPMFYPMRRPKTHMAIVVELAGRLWLCDLGFGSYGITAPLALDALNEDVVQGNDRFRLSKAEEGDFLLQSWVDGAWANQFSFGLQAQEWVDFEPSNFMNSKHPDAVFVKSLLVISHHARGRSILFGNVLKTVVDGEVNKRVLTQPEVEAALVQTFGIHRPAPATAMATSTV